MKIDIVNIFFSNLGKRKFCQKSDYSSIMEQYNKRQQNPLYGELNETYNYDISLSKVSHIIENIIIENNIIKGEIRVLDTQQGKILKSLVSNNLIGLSARSIGKIEDDGTITIEKLLTLDAITYNKIELRRQKLERILNESTTYNKHLEYYNYIYNKCGATNDELLKKINECTSTQEDMDKYSDTINQSIQYKEYVLENLNKAIEYYNYLVKFNDGYNFPFIENKLEYIKNNVSTQNLYDTKLLEHNAKELNETIYKLEEIAEMINKQKERLEKIKRICEK